jgi:hypothetical protein
MLDYARQRAIEILRTARTAILATGGPAGVQAGEFPCQAAGLALYLLVPEGSDHLFNLEQNAAASLLSEGWALNGEARVVRGEVDDLDLALLRSPAAQGCVLVRVEPRQVHARREGGWGALETIDL